jgi:pantothenate kinase
LDGARAISGGLQRLLDGARDRSGSAVFRVKLQIGGNFLKFFYLSDFLTCARFTTFLTLEIEKIMEKRIQVTPSNVQNWEGMFFKEFLNVERLPKPTKPP